MPTFSSLPRWIGGKFLGRNPSNTINNVGDSSDDPGVAVIADDNPVISMVECYACTQVGVPVFHSTSCADSCHQPEWEASAGSYLVPIQNRPGKFARAVSKPNWGVLGKVLDPRSKRVQLSNRALLLARGVALAIDPLFFYALSIGREGSPCLYMDGGLAAVVTVARTVVDAVHLFHVWLQFRLAYVSRESLVVGCGKLVWDARAIASHYMRSFKGFWFDVFVILPVPQVVFWLVVPKLIREERIKIIMTTLLLIFLFQFLPKVYHSISMMRRMQKVTGYIFGTIWWGFGLNLIAYFIASHVAGGCWYVLAIQRVASCLQQQCERTIGCNLSLACSEEVCYKSLLPETIGNPCGGNSTMMSKPVCLDIDGPYKYGIYQWALPVISSNSLAVKILYPIFWGLMTLSTFGNDLEPTSNWLEVIFSICIVLSGLLLFTLLIGNIQVFLHAVMAKKRKMQLRCRDMEWWMRRRQLPSRLRQRVRHFERQRWAAMGGEDEMELIKDLPEGLRRDIKRHLCLDLIKKVPLFHNLDDLILDNICDRVKPLVFSRDEKIIREGDPVPRMVFIVRGRIKRNQSLSKGIVATSVLEPGGFLGDELLSWCLRRPFIDRLPASSATFVCLESTEAFGLDAQNLRYITDHFRYKFANERLKRTARYYSSNWRTWAAVNIQLAYRRYRQRTRGPVTPVRDNGGTERRLMQYAAMFMSIRPHDHLE
ncbi:putative potassium channel, voltage-dependent, ELK [Medicago truncatula]|uniref:Cyclic nucleotide-gated ion channel protein, putative n=1 Tax=Medicago truncatula TaxID=3880 RepID=G7L453_MEDTR|nr:cyclic nucleotide-gated ion channel 2 [Medicago truncatula]AES77570.1 cyclic nucleotide-gated ion channel protein, putative [Medicago truncatula]RHN44341.1 putative potassium channel, voltage-dependent, ELK [Medicago truncatula]